MAAWRTILFLMLFRALTWAGEPCTNGVFLESGFALLDHVYKSFYVHHLVSCFMSCTAEAACQSLNYNPVDDNCELNKDTKHFRPKYFVKRPAFIYAENPDAETPWRKLNSAPVCFGAKDNKFGRFQVEVGGSIQAIKLVHLSGYVSCDSRKSSRSNWGCAGQHRVRNIALYLTNASNTILLPMGIRAPYTIPGYDAQSSEIVFSGFPNPLHLSSDKELRLWYWADLVDWSENDNGGTSCTDVFAK